MIPVLEQMSEEDLHKALSAFNNHDLTNLDKAISVLVIEIPSINLNRTFSSSRVHLKSLVQKNLSKQFSIRQSKVSRNTHTKAKTQDEKPDEPLAQATTESPKDDLEESEEAEEEEQEDDNFPHNRRTTGLVGDCFGFVPGPLLLCLLHHESCSQSHCHCSTNRWRFVWPLQPLVADSGNSEHHDGCMA